MRVSLLLIAPVMLAGCNLIGGNQQAAQADAPTADQPVAAGPSDAAGTMLPGLWRNTAEVIEIHMPNLPGGMTPPTMPPQTTSRCVRPEEATNPTFGLLAGNVQAGCRTERFSYDGGRIEGAATCNQSGLPVHMTMNGQFNPTTYVMIIETRAESQAGPISTRMRIAGDRIGECTAP